MSLRRWRRLTHITLALVIALAVLHIARNEPARPASLPADTGLAECPRP